MGWLPLTEKIIFLNGVLIRREICYKALYDFTSKLELMGCRFDSNCTPSNLLAKYVSGWCSRISKKILSCGETVCDMIASALWCLDASPTSPICGGQMTIPNVDVDSDPLSGVEGEYEVKLACDGSEISRKMF